ncbi:hypothetical protein [Methanocalculus sp. MC3]
MESGWLINQYHAPRTIWHSTSDSYLNKDEYSWRIHLQQLLEKYIGHTCMSFCEIFNQDQFLSSYPGESTTFPLDIEQSLLSLQQYLEFIFPNPGEVASYLRQNIGLYDVVLYACMLTKETFGNTAQVTLELYSDPEIDDKYLTLCIRQSHYDADIMEKIDSICSMYEKALTDQTGWFIVTTDFRPPTV